MFPERFCGCTSVKVQPLLESSCSVSGWYNSQRCDNAGMRYMQASIMQSQFGQSHEVFCDENKKVSESSSERK